MFLYGEMSQIRRKAHSLGIGGRKAPKIWEGYRPTTHINRRVTQSIFRAFDYVKEIGTPLNLYVVINLHESNAASMATIFESIRHKYRDWLNYKGQKVKEAAAPPTYIYAIENPNDAHPHANWAVYIPQEFESDFRRKLPRWIEKAQGVCGDFDCHIQRINQDYAKRLAKYVVKATDPEFIDHFHLQGIAAPQGTVYGKRAGVSPSLGHTVRREAGFRPARGRYWRLAA